MHKKVMVIDDSEIDLYIAERVVERFKYAEETILMGSAIEALEYLIANAENIQNLPSYIFLDINMPEMNGFEFLDKFTTLHDNIKNHCIIMMLTTSVHEEDKERAAKNPFVRGYLNKPLNQEKFKTLQ